MTVATQTRAEFLKAAERSAVAVDAAIRARWGDAAGDTAQSSVLVDEAAAAAEAARQLALLGFVLADDAVTIEGVFFDLEGETLSIDYALPVGVGTHFGGASAVEFLVVKARPDPGQGTTSIEGFVRL